VAKRVANCGGLLISDNFSVNSTTKELEITTGSIDESKLSTEVQLKLNATQSGISDGVTINITNDVISVKDKGISLAKLSDDLVLDLNSVVTTQP